MYQVIPYQPSDYERWNAFVAQSRNGTFLFHRDFMEYHQDRFHDFSMLVVKEEKVVALLPAHRVDNAVFSHWGLTYGGLVLPVYTHISEVIGIVQSILNYLLQSGIETLHLKEIPSFYCQGYNGDLAYILHQCQAQITRADLLSTLDLTLPLAISKSRKESIRRGQKNGLIVREETDLTAFWNELLIPNLAQRHAAKPVHTLEEMTLLQSRFPQNIRHFNVYEGENLIAGTTVFCTGRVAHPQYIAGDDRRSETGALDFLYHFLITEVYSNCLVFDFGISNENQGKNINSGLQFWKESYGAQPVVQHFYRVATASYVQLDSILL
ncbi:GNAT family N-acetyltransferase [Flavobacterium stagni]|nr:GNAT family N-acetyltransferase [Flavobacterium stagni]